MSGRVGFWAETSGVKTSMTDLIQALFDFFFT